MFRLKALSILIGMLVAQVAAGQQASSTDPAPDGGGFGDESESSGSAAVTAEPVELIQDLIRVESRPDEEPAVAKPRRRAMLEEIVVTAQRREENVRDVPMAMTVLSADDLRDAGIADFNDLTLLVPNVSINTDWFTMYLRGVGTSEVNVAAEQAVAYLFDDLYVSRVEFLRAGFLDIERMEVLKGPQGTLFGRNSPAGAINITQGAPEFERGGRIDLKYGDLGTRDIEAVVTGPLSGDDVAFRLAGSSTHADPHTRNLYDPAVPIGGKETNQVRGKLLWAVDEALSVTLSAEYFDYDFGQYGIHEHSYTPEIWTTLVRTQDRNFEGTMDRRGTSRDGASSVGDGSLVSVTVDFEAWDQEFSWVTGHAAYHDYSSGDFDGTAFPVLDVVFENEYAQISSELKMVSPPGAVEYVAGVFAFGSEMDAYFEGTTLPNVDTRFLQDVLIPAELAASPLGGLFDRLEDVLFGGSQTIFAGDRIACSGCALKTTSLAGFGQLTWHVSDTWTVLAGGRYTWESKEYEGHLHPEDGAVLWPVLLVGNGFDVEKKRTYRDFSPKLSLTWAPTGTVTSYVTYAKGFRSGSFNIVSLKEEGVEFKPEESRTYEVGIKSDWLDGLARVNLGFFLTDYHDYQITTFETVTFASSNAEHVQVRGMEMDFVLMPLEGTVLVGSLGRNDGRYVKYAAASCPTQAPGARGEGSCALPQGFVNLPPDTSTDLSGRPLFRAPDWTGSLTVVQSFPLPLWNSMLIGSVTGAYRGFEFFDPDLDPRDSQNAYWLFNARIGIRQTDGRWGLEVHVDNLTDELVRLSSYDAPVLSGAHVVQTNKSRTTYVTFSYSF